MKTKSSFRFFPVIKRSVVALATCGVVAIFAGGRPAQAALITVNTTNVASQAGLCSLLDAITAVNTQLPKNACPAGDGANDTIQLAAATYATTTALKPTRSVIIRGAGMRNTTITATGITTKCDGSTSLPAAVVVVGTGFGVSLFGLTVQGNNSDALVGLCAAGGSVNLSTARVDVKSFHAGGIVGRRGAMIGLTSSVVEGNTSATNGGGVNIDTASSLSTWGTSIINNTAAQAGGGLYWRGLGGQVQESTFSGNVAGTSGGGIYMSLSTANGGFYGALYSSTVASNSANTAGGLFAASAAYHFISNDTIIAANSSTDGTNPNLNSGFGNNLVAMQLAYTMFGPAGPIACNACLSDLGACPAPPNLNSASTCVTNVSSTAIKLAGLASIGGADAIPVKAPQAGSTAIDLIAPNDPTVSHAREDQRGASRPRFSTKGSLSAPWHDSGAIEVGTSPRSRWEAEDLEIASKSPDLIVLSNGAERPWSQTGGRLGGGMGLILQADGSGASTDFVVFKVPVDVNGTLALSIGAVTSYNGGKFQVSVATTAGGTYSNVGSVQDTYASAFQSVNYYNIGNLSMTGAPGFRYVKIAVASKNPSSLGSWLYLDSLTVGPPCEMSEQLCVGGSVPTCFNTTWGFEDEDSSAFWTSSNETSFSRSTAHPHSGDWSYEGYGSAFIDSPAQAFTFPCHNDSTVTVDARNKKLSAWVFLNGSFAAGTASCRLFAVQQGFVRHNFTSTPITTQATWVQLNANFTSADSAVFTVGVECSVPTDWNSSPTKRWYVDDVAITNL